MGAACCKRLEPESSSPHLPFCEVVRRCARVICPVDPPQQKPVYRTRKYGLSDIVGPISKKDSWVQTDPLPPPRTRRGKKQRRRSRSVEFIPYLIRKGTDEDSEAVARSSGSSLEYIPRDEEVLDFQLYFMGRLPMDTSDDGKEVLSDKKKQFLSGLLGEENNNVILGPQEERITKEEPKSEEAKITNIEPVKNLAEEKVVRDEKSKVEEATLLRSFEVVKLAPPNSDLEVVSSNSRRSSITESLKEFETSLMDMLEEEEGSLTSGDHRSRDEDDEEDVVVRMMVPLRKKDLPPLREETEEEYCISPLDEGEESGEDKGKPGSQEKDVEEECGAVKPEGNKGTEKKEMMSSEDQGKRIALSAGVENLAKNKMKEPPTITVEIVS